MRIEELLRAAVSAKASDVHLAPQLAPMLRIDGRLVRRPGAELTATDLSELAQDLVPASLQETLAAAGEVDFSFGVPGVGRFRANVYRQRGVLGIALRVVAESVPTLAGLGLPEVLEQLARRPNGLVLVTGPTGSGKSTTLAAMIDLINSERDCHIVTLEDPIEYLHQHRRCIITQREIGPDTRSYAGALRAALRQDPDVILVGEMRDQETIATALTAAETGHLVLSTLHTNDAAQTVDRIIDVFPPTQQGQIRIQLAGTLQGIIAQQLFPRADGPGRVLALEILVATPAVRNLIREGKTHQIVSAVQTGGALGMRSLTRSVDELFQQGKIRKADYDLWHQVEQALHKMQPGGR